MQEGHVRGWDDPRMPTIAGIRRRGYTPEAHPQFLQMRSAFRRPTASIELALLEHHVREDLNKRAPRVMAVLRPLRVVIDNYPEGQVEEMEAVNNPEDAAAGTRKVPFSRVLYIEQDDFREDPPKQYFRLSPGREVRLRYGYFITCTGVVKDDNGEVVEIHCTYDPATRGGNAPDGRKVKSTIHWVSAAHAVDAEVRLYDNLFIAENPNETEEGEDFTANLNPAFARSADRLQTRAVACAMPRRASRYQFERLGYFCVDPDSAPGKPVFNRTVALSDTWAKIEKAQQGRKDDHSRNRRHPGRCRQRHSERWRTGRRRGGIQAGAARHAHWGGPTNCPSNPSPRVWNWPASGPRTWTAWPSCVRFRLRGCGLSPASCARIFRIAASCAGGASPRARRLGLLSFAFRRGHGAHARPRRRFPLRLALAGAGGSS